MSSAHSHHFFTPPVPTSKEQKEMKSNAVEDSEIKEYRIPIKDGKSGEVTSRKLPQYKKNIPIWMVVGSGALLYTCLALINPQFLAPQNSGVQENALMDAKKELEIVLSKIENLIKDTSELKTSLSQTASQQQALAERVAMIDSKFETTAAKVATLTDPQKSTEKTKMIADKGGIKTPEVSSIENTKLKNDPVVKQKSVAQSADSVKIINSPNKPLDTQNIETSSVEPVLSPAQTDKFKTSVNKTASGGLGLQIATGPSVDSLRLSWNFLSEKHSENLKSLEPRYTTTSVGNETIYNLVVGPVLSEADAKKMCNDLGAKAIPCNIIKGFSGEAL